MKYDLRILFLLFILYSFTGWFLEVVGKLIEKGKIINRGFLIGPYCPIYGIGCVSMILFLDRYLDDALTLFIMSIILFSILEYSTSFLMEKMFKIRWWDYTRYKFNINGRICLETMIPFGLGGLLILFVINPMFLEILNKLPDTFINILTTIILILFILDILTSVNVISNLENTVKNVKKDSTEEITLKVKEILSNKNYIKRRIIKAFPKLKIK